MNITICAVGKLANSPEQQLIHHYMKAMPFAVNIIELTPSKDKNTHVRKQQEAQLIENHIKHHQLITLDEHGKNLSSMEWAQQVQSWQENHDDIMMMIGGADGLHKNLLDKAKYKFSFGKATFPHALVRVLIVEQIYRAAMILQNHPYHRG